MKEIVMKIKPNFILILMVLGINLQPVSAQEEVTLLTFGDSITAGLIEAQGSTADCPPGVVLDESYSGSGDDRCFGYGAEGVGGYQPGLKTLIEELGYQVSIYNYGYSGINTSLMRSIDSSVFDQKPDSDYVLIMGGANDVFDDDISASTVKDNLQSMVNTACAKGMIPVLATITRNHVSSTYTSISSSYNNEIREIDTQSSACDVLQAEQYYALYDRSNYGIDGLHLSSQGNSNMVDEWFAALALPSLLLQFNSEYLPAVIMLLLDD